MGNMYKVSKRFLYKQSIPPDRGMINSYFYMYEKKRRDSSSEQPIGSGILRKEVTGVCYRR
jgi:hypothetical protein